MSHADDALEIRRARDCPFCGARPALHRTRYREHPEAHWGWRYTAVCLRCQNVLAPRMTEPVAFSARLAVQAWNRCAWRVLSVPDNKRAADRVIYTGHTPGEGIE